LDFFNQFISYIIEKKDFPNFEKGLKYIMDIETFFYIIDKNKEAIYKKYNAQKLENIIKLDDLKFKKNNKENEPQNEIFIEETISKVIIPTKEKKEKNIFEVTNNIRSIIRFCKEQKTFLIYFTNNFWKY
jgi:hypothetical protein